VLARESLLNRMQGPALLEALDGEHRGILALHREYGAGLDRHAVEVDRASAAMARLAADVRSGMLEALAQV
jgi:hypothetical protein